MIVKSLRILLFLLSNIVFFMQNANASTLSWWDMSPQEVREKINQRIMNIEAPIPTVFSVRDHTVRRHNLTTPIRIYTPCKEGHFPVILFIHGGAWVAGNLDTHDNLARCLCSETKAIVVSVEYLNSPEGKFPLPLEQCYDTLIWITEQGHKLAIDATRIAVVGDSAGGNMAAALCLMARDRIGPKIALQLLINPALDLTCNGTIVRQNDSLDILRWQATQYLSHPNDTTNPYVSPLCATDLSNLPSAVILLAEQDDLRETAQKYADRLQAAGISTFVYCQRGVNHLAGYAAKASSDAQETLDVTIEELQRAFARGANSHTENLFSYGTLRYENVQLTTFGRKLIGQVDSLRGYCLKKVKITDPDVIAKSGEDVHSIIHFSGNHQDQIPGMVFKISQEELEQADKYEVDDYKRIKVELLSGTFAWVYVSINNP